MSLMGQASQDAKTMGYQKPARVAAPGSCAHPSHDADGTVVACMASLSQNSAK